MAKSKNAKRKQQLFQETTSKKIKSSAPLTPPHEATDPQGLEPQTLDSVIPEEDVEITIETLQTLSQYPQFLKTKACKDLRVAVYDFQRACTTGVNVNASGASLLTILTILH